MINNEKKDIEHIGELGELGEMFLILEKLEK